MSLIDVPSECMHCFIVSDEISALDQMEVEELQTLGLYETATLKWHAWQPGVDD